MNNNLFLGTMVGHISQIENDCKNLIDIVNYCRQNNLPVESIVFQEFTDLVIDVGLKMGEIARYKQEIEERKTK